MVDFSKKTKEEIVESVLDTWKHGTSKDSRMAVEEAKRYGVSYEELCKEKEEREK